MATYEQAVQAKEKLLQRLIKGEKLAVGAYQLPNWLLLIRVARPREVLNSTLPRNTETDPTDYVVELGVHKLLISVKDSLPKEVEGVPVVLHPMRDSL